MRVGIGYDIHPLVPGRRLVVGGVQLPHDKGLAGHSDADVLIHSICDALLGAADLGDIGLHFPADDDAYRDAPSTEFLRAVVELLRKNGSQIENIDAVIIAQEPRFRPFFDQMKRTIASAAGISSDRVSLKGKCPEGVGALGRKEAIAAYSVALLTHVPGE